MFKPEQLHELARACRALASHIGEKAKEQKGTSVYAGALAEQARFEELAKLCEDRARHARS